MSHAMPNLDQYHYILPEELIAKEPATPRDSARLFVYDTASDTVTFDTFANLASYVSRYAVMVFNDTKVLPARLFLRKETGGRIEVLLAMNEVRPGDTTVKGVVDRNIEVGAKLFFQNGEYFTVVRQEEQYFFFEPSVPLQSLTSLLMREGHTPIPPYIKNSPLTETELRQRYQSILARDGSSIAAPTASLHFTGGVLDSLRDNLIERAMVTLHVGAGTFAPLRPEHFETNSLFTEYCAIEKDTADRINRAKDENRPIIPVGSTAMRTLESFAAPFLRDRDITDTTGPTCLNRSVLLYGEKETNIFIHPPYEFRVATGLVTNFHVPRSSLMLMVDAFLEHKCAKRRIMDLYKIAIDERFRFYSFGDGMLIL
jgi:S-adenosylmethionine:tRNA ribosyltransferase-isomerase